MKYPIHIFYSSSEFIQYIPTYYTFYSFNRLADLVQLGEPTFNSEKINKGIEALPRSLQLLSAAVKVLNDSIVKEILSEYH